MTDRRFSLERLPTGSVKVWLGSTLYGMATNVPGGYRWRGRYQLGPRTRATPTLRQVLLGYARLSVDETNAALETLDGYRN